EPTRCHAQAYHAARTAVGRCGSRAGGVGSQRRQGRSGGRGAARASPPDLVSSRDTSVPSGYTEVRSCVRSVDRRRRMLGTDTATGPVARTRRWLVRGLALMVVAALGLAAFRAARPPGPIPTLAPRALTVVPGVHL